MADTMTTQELADLFGYNIRRIQQLTKDGIIPQESRNAYVLSDVVKHLVKLNLDQSETIRQKSERIAAMETARPKSDNPETDFDTLVAELAGKDFSDYTKGDLEKIKVLVDIRDKNMRLMERQGVLVNAEEVKRSAAEVAAAIRTRLFQIPGKLADALAVTLDADEIQSMLDAAIDEALQELTS